jgi:hypothetical protein
MTSQLYRSWDPKKYKQGKSLHSSLTEGGSRKKNTNKKKDDIPTSPKLGGNKQITQKKKDDIPVLVKLEEKNNEEEER